VCRQVAVCARPRNAGKRQRCGQACLGIQVRRKDMEVGVGVQVVGGEGGHRQCEVG